MISSLFFHGIGSYFYQNAEFISSGKGDAPGTLADISLEDNSYSTGFLSFLRLVGTVYTKKHASGFSTPTPATNFNRFHNDELAPLEQHKKWLDDIRHNIWDRVQFENDMVPTTDALYRHWKRTCWVLDMWRQADKNQLTVMPLCEYGWHLQGNSLAIDWDSESNMTAVRDRVAGLLRGCHCKTGCGTRRCGCKGKDKFCSEGCECINCSNTPGSDKSDELQDVIVSETLSEEGNNVPDELDDIMDWIFSGTQSDSEEDSPCWEPLSDHEDI